MADKKRHRVLSVLAWIVLAMVILAVLLVGVPNAVVVGTSASKIVSVEEAQQQDADCILVLGALVLPDGTPSPILQDRIDRGVELYFAGAAPKIIMSGDHGYESYNEVLGMKNYAISKGVPSEDIFCDHAGFSTYESMYRAQSIFGAESMIVVTQTYHLYRALYAANGLGIDAVGVESDLRDYGGQLQYDLREIPARTKDFFQTLFKVPFAFDGEYIGLDQSGDVTEG